MSILSILGLTKAISWWQNLPLLTIIYCILEKRDISDLKRDPLLQTLNHKKEPESGKSRSLSSTLYGKYNVPFNLYKRQADSTDELMSFNQQNNLNSVEQQLQRRVDIPLQPPIANPLPVPDTAYNQYQPVGSPLQQKAVDPSLFASNYLPLQSGYTGILCNFWLSETTNLNIL